MSGTMNFHRDGAELLPAVLDVSKLNILLKLFDDKPTGKPGIRLAGTTGLAAYLAADISIGRIAANALGPSAKPVRAILFDKAEGNNWSLAWHQDRTIAVRARLEMDGFGPWSIKSGVQHVAPPWEVLSAMVTLRIHLDPVDQDNAPLLVVPGSHVLGRIAERDISAIAASRAPVTCLAEAGDVWLYSTPILHASDVAKRPSRRRVLQVDYAAIDLPGGLEWLGIEASLPGRPDLSSSLAAARALA